MKTKEVLKLNIFLLKKDIDKVNNILYDKKVIEFFKLKDSRIDFFDLEQDEDISQKSKDVLELKSIINTLEKFKTKNIKSKNILSKNEIEKRYKILRETKKDLKQLEFESSQKSFKQKNKLDKIRVDFEKQVKEFRTISNENLEKYIELYDNKVKKLSLRKVKNKFKTTDDISILSGFIQKDKFEEIKSLIKKEVNNDFDIEVLKITEDDKVPTIMKNPKIVNSFEELVKMNSVPSYKEIDPTFLMFLTFPIFYGFILGDVVYGLISLAFFTFLKFKFKKLKTIMNIFIISSFSSIIFGWIYGEFIGFEPHNILFLEAHKHFGFFIRSHSPETLLVIAVIFGIVHINIGFILGIINNIKNKKKIFSDYVSWIIFEICVLFLYLGFTFEVDLYKYIGYFFLSVVLVLLYVGHGILGIIEIPSFFSNILSYARLMAIGISSIVIAMLINEYSIVFFEKGTFWIIIGVVLFSIGHIFNIILGNFESFIHSLRLHYVEQFTKFYKGGGSLFNPFGKKEESN